MTRWKTGSTAQSNKKDSHLSSRSRASQDRADEGIDKQRHAPSNTLADHTSRTKIRSGIDDESWREAQEEYMVSLKFAKTRERERERGQLLTAPNDPTSDKNHNHGDTRDEEGEDPEPRQWLRGRQSGASDRVIDGAFFTATVGRAGMARHDDEQERGDAARGGDDVEGVPERQVGRVVGAVADLQAVGSVEAVPQREGQGEGRQQRLFDDVVLERPQVCVALAALAEDESRDQEEDEREGRGPRSHGPKPEQHECVRPEPVVAQEVRRREHRHDGDHGRDDSG